jgi:hypothetical protein
MQMRNECNFHSEPLQAAEKKENTNFAQRFWSRARSDERGIAVAL